MDRKIKEVKIFMDTNHTLSIDNVKRVIEYGGRENNPLRIEIRCNDEEYAFILDNIIGYRAIYE